MALSLERGWQDWVLVAPLEFPAGRSAVPPPEACVCFAEVMKASQQAIERGVKDCLFVDYKRRSGHFDVTTVASIKEITEKVPVASD